MPPEMTTVDTDHENTDNLVVEKNVEPSTVDDNLTEINQEPEADVDEEAEKQRFATLEIATKSYSELEKKLGEQSNELGELRKKAAEAEQLKERLANIELQEAKDKGFETVSQYKSSKEMASFIADNYEQYLNECRHPDEVKKLLDEYREDPSEEYLEAIESQFSLKTIKEVAGNTKDFEGQLQAKEQEALQSEIISSAKSYLDENVAKYLDDFKNPAFAALYGEAFRAYGCDLNTEKFVALMRNFAESVIKNNAIKAGINSENSEETNEIAGLTSGGVSNNTGSGKSLLQLSDKELDKRLAELI